MSDIIENNNLPKNINDEDINKTEKSNSKEQENKEIIYKK